MKKRNTKKTSSREAEKRSDRYDRRQKEKDRSITRRNARKEKTKYSVDEDNDE